MRERNCARLTLRQQLHSENAGVFLLGVPGIRAVLRPGEAGLVMRGRSLDDSGGRSRWFGAGDGRILREPTPELV